MSNQEGNQEYEEPWLKREQTPELQALLERYRKFLETVKEAQ
jgi:hypothetical protein